MQPLTGYSIAIFASTGISGSDRDWTESVLECFEKALSCAKRYVRAFSLHHPNSKWVRGLRSRYLRRGTDLLARLLHAECHQLGGHCIAWNSTAEVY